jgi:hypothetical protein
MNIRVLLTVVRLFYATILIVVMVECLVLRERSKRRCSESEGSLQERLHHSPSPLMLADAGDVTHFTWITSFGFPENTQVMPVPVVPGTRKTTLCGINYPSFFLSLNLSQSLNLTWVERRRAYPKSKLRLELESIYLVFKFNLSRTKQSLPKISTKFLSVRLSSQ